MIPESVIGNLSVLNCGEGDIRVSFDKEDQHEIARAEKIIVDMLKRGYLLFVDEGDGKLRRVKAFDKTRQEYILADGPIVEPENVDQTTNEGQTETTKGPSSKTRRSKKKGDSKGERRVPLRKGRATGVAPTAGG